MLAITPKRYQRNLVTYLTSAETEALLAACDTSTWTGRRDHALIMLAAQTGLRISELDRTHHERCHPRHRRARPHDRQGTQRQPHPATADRPTVLGPGSANAPAPTTRCSRPAPAPLSRDAIEQRIASTPQTAAHLPVPTAKTSRHTLRHTCAMSLLHAGNDVTVIALWLGHEQVSTTSSTCTPT